MAKEFQHVRGMPDILPEESVSYRYLTEAFQKLAYSAGYGLIDTPILEDTGVFVRGLGSETDAVDKEMYRFEDRSGNEVALRPEPTAGIVRAYIEHGMASRPQPVKLQVVGPMFRYDRPQAGRQRQFHQLGVEVIGDASPSIDAQIITLALRYFREIGLHKLTLQINSLGDKKDRENYLRALVAYLKDHRSELAEIDRERVETNPLRVLDSKELSTRQVVEGAPQILDHLSDASKAHFTGVLEYLDELKIGYELNPLLVRGLDYYTHTVFEFYGEREGAQSSLGGGGRYDGLVEQLGGKPTPAAGFGLGLERLILELKEEKVDITADNPVKVYVASIGEPARLAAFTLIERLLDAGIGAVGAVDKDSIGSQLQRANKLGLQYALIVGQKEVQDQAAILRDMSSGAQEILPLKTITKDIAQRLNKS